MDPARIEIIPDHGDRMAPLTVEQAVQAVRNPSQRLVGVLLFGVVGYLANRDTQERWAKEVEARILRSGELPPGAPVKGSVYFKPNPKMTQFALSLGGMSVESGDSLTAAAVANCQVPTRSSASAPSPRPTPTVRAVALSARAAAGPVTLAVSNAQFTDDLTALTIAIENTADVEANLFSAIGSATLTDSKGRSYPVRMLRSDLAERVGPRSRIQGTLAFEPMPVSPPAASAVLTIPEIRVGSDVYEIKTELRF